MSQSSGRPEVGAVLAGKYRITRVLGEGAMGVVFEAVNIRLGQRVAIKLPQPSGLEQSIAVERFARDVRAAARLRSHNSVRVIDAEVTDSGVPFMVMELLEGRDVEVELAERGALPVNEAVSYVRQACSALVEAHSHGIVHGGLKPSNLFLSRESDGTRCIKVLNLGVFRAHASTRHFSGLEVPGNSARYLAPEQVQASKVVDPRCDVWALGAILYELLSGRPPFEGPSGGSADVELLSRPQSLTSPIGELPSRLEEMVFKALEMRPEDRFASALAMLAALTPSALRPGPAEPFRSARDARNPVAGVAQREPHAVPLAATQEPALAATREPEPAATRRPRWRDAALLSPFLVLATILYMTRCNDQQQHSADDRGVTTTVLALAPGAETQPVPHDNAEPLQVGTAKAEVTGTADAAAPAQALPTESRMLGTTEPPPSVIEASGTPLEGSEPLRRQSPSAPKAGQPPLNAESAVKVRGLSKLPSTANSPPINPAVRAWDEDSPVPP